ncbi:MAG: carbohydrate kinase family protein [Thermosipho sp. (in: Bacteria)]|nr:carbohydrate kinase family protein [Thermosipho sp. (in: thermotogales)]
MYYNEKRKFDVTCIGKANLDIFYYVDTLEHEKNHIAKEFYYYAGGKATNVAINLSRLGLKTALISAIGNDIFGQKLLEILEKENVKFNGSIVNASTSLTSIIVDDLGKNTIFHNLGANSLLSPKLIPENLSFVFIQSGIPIKSLIKAINSSKRIFLELSETSQFDQLKNYLKKVEFVSLNESELNNIFKTDNLETNLELLSKYTNNIFLKMGEKGLLYKTTSGKIFYKPAKKIKVKNTTGAGDAASSAFIFGIINNWDIEKILSFSIDYSSKIVKSKYST